MKNPMPLVTFPGREAADPVQKRLAESGIPTVINDLPKLETFWFVSRNELGVRIEVAADQFERAYQLLLEWDAADGTLRDAIRCPECRSFRVLYPQYTRRSLIPNMIVGTLAALGHEKDYYCEDCHFTWPKKSDHPERQRPHMAPNYFIEDAESAAAAKPSPGPNPERTG